MFHFILVCGLLVVTIHSCGNCFSNVTEAIVDEAIVDEAIADEAIVDEAIADEAIADEAIGYESEIYIFQCNKFLPLVFHDHVDPRQIRVKQLYCSNYSLHYLSPFHHSSAPINFLRCDRVAVVTSFGISSAVCDVLDGYLCSQWELVNTINNKGVIVYTHICNRYDAMLYWLSPPPSYIRCCQWNIVLYDGLSTFTCTHVCLYPIVRDGDSFSYTNICKKVEMEQKVN
jgi:hypothetical protein